MMDQNTPILESENLHQLEGLKTFFNTVTEYPSTLMLETFAVIVDLPLFIKSHTRIVEANINKSRFVAPYLHRLEKVARVLEKREAERKRMDVAA